MISARELISGLYGAYRLCRFDRSGLSYFDATPQGFWRSFVSALLVAPLHFAVTYAALEGRAIEADTASVVVVELCAYVILVFAYPLAMHYVCRLLDRDRQYILYIVAYNWAGVILSLLALPAIVLDSGAALHDIASVVALAVTVASLAMMWFIARIALEVPVLTAVAVVVLDVVLELIIRSVAEARLGIS
jgi:hypothetical protein